LFAPTYVDITPLAAIIKMAASDNKILKVVVIGIGQMGSSHLLAYHRNPGYQVVGIVSKHPPVLAPETQLYRERMLPDLGAALALKPDVVSINTHTDTHAEYAIAALEAGAHVFIEKPLASTVEDAKRVVDVAKRAGKKLVVGYILRHHPSWQEFIKQARALGPPFVMRMNLNQRSTGSAWDIHKRIMETTSPIVDCGVHYIDVMLQISDGQPLQVRGMGARLTNEVSPDQVNYSHLQLTFDDGSVGWYEAGWGPMISETAYFIKDVMTPNGSVSIVKDGGGEGSGSADVAWHTRTSKIRVTKVGKPPHVLAMEDEPDHDGLCALEQEFLLAAIRDDKDLSKHLDDAVRPLAIALAADRSMKENTAIDLQDILL
jgi:predicted dehydrogenase